MNAKDYYERGNKHYDEGNFDGAIADYTEVIRLEPDNCTAYSTRGMSYEQKNELDLAIADFNKAIQLKPHDGIYYQRAGVHFSKGDKNLAISDLEMAIKLNPTKEDYPKTLKSFKETNDDEYHEFLRTFNALNDDPRELLNLKGIRETLNDDEQNELLRTFNALNYREQRDFLLGFSSPNDDMRRELLNNVMRSIRSSKSSSPRELLRKEIKVILIMSIIGGVVGAFVFAVLSPAFGESGELIAAILVGIWMGLCFGGTITLVPFIFKLGWNLLDFLLGLLNRLPDSVIDFFRDVIHVIFSGAARNPIRFIFRGVARIAIRFIFFLLRLQLGASCVIVWLWVCVFAGPIWPLIRILMKRSKLKKIAE